MLEIFHLLLEYLLLLELEDQQYPDLCNLEFVEQSKKFQIRHTTLKTH